MGMKDKNMSWQAAPDGTTVALHTASLGAITGVFLQILPVLAVLLPVIYYGVLIWESKTFEHWRNNLRTRRIARRVAKLRAKAKVTEAKLEAAELIRHAHGVAADKVAHAATLAKTLVVEADVKQAEKKINKD